MLIHVLEAIKGKVKVHNGLHKLFENDVFSQILPLWHADEKDLKLGLAHHFSNLLLGHGNCPILSLHTNLLLLSCRGVYAEIVAFMLGSQKIEIINAEFPADGE